MAVVTVVTWQLVVLGVVEAAGHKYISNNKTRNLKKKNLLMAQTTCLASFGPIFVVFALPRPFLPFKISIY